MLLSHSIPLQFLIPSWTPQQLSRLVRRASSKILQPPTPSQRKSQKRASLFQELFPEEKEPPQNGPVVRETTFERLPPFKWLDPPKSAVRKIVKGTDMREEAGKTATQEVDSPPESEHTYTDVLVIHRASKTLEETDFYRMSPKGRHIEGWTNGIVKIIQARDEVTLDPLGTYYIMFSSSRACYAYELAMRNLHTLAKIQNKATVSGIHLHPPRHLTDPLDDHEASLQGFTLLPAHDGTSIYRLDNPFDRGVTQLFKNGVPAALAPVKQKVGEMVLLCAEEGGIDELELKEALKYDGKRRNLDWRLVGKNKGIKKISGSKVWYDPVEGHGKLGEGDKALLRKRNAGFPAPSKFVLTFEDRAEARRFVREWHRRRLPSKAVLYPGDDEPPMICAEVIW